MATTRTLEETAAIYANKRFGSFVVGDDFYLKKGRWHTVVKCDCGLEQEVMTSRLPLHKDCNCKVLAVQRAYKERYHSFYHLIKIWPKVIKAGRQATEKHNGMA